MSTTQPLPADAPDETRTDTAVIDAPTEVISTGEPPEPEAREIAPPARWEDPNPWPCFTAAGGPERASGILPCGRCGKAHEDGHASAYPNLHGILRVGAKLAGWDTDEDGTWCCPACLGKNLSITDGVDWADGIGTTVYEERLALHMDIMREIDERLAKAREEISGGYALEAIHKRLSDAALASGVPDLDRRDVLTGGLVPGHPRHALEAGAGAAA